MNNLVELTGQVSFVAPLADARGAFSMINLMVDGEPMTVMAWDEAHADVELAGIRAGDQVALEARLNLEQTDVKGEAVSLPTIQLVKLVAVERARFDKVA